MKSHLLIGLLLLFSTDLVSQEKIVLRMGTIAVEGSEWANVYHEMKNELETKSKGLLGLKIYHSSDENDLIQLFNNKQCDILALTISGVGKLVPESYLLSLPFLFSSYEELNFVKNKLTARFIELFHQRNYQFLGWGDFGFVYFFSKKPIKTYSDFQKTKLWVWSLDPIGKMFAEGTVKDAAFLPLQSVLPGLQKNEIQTVYNSSYGILAFQWHTQIQYMADLPLAAGVGITLMAEDTFSKQSIENQNLIQETMQKYHEKLVKNIELQNQNSQKILKENGMTVIHVPLLEQRKWKQIGINIQNRLSGEFFEKSLLEEVRKYILEYKQQ